MYGVYWCQRRLIEQLIYQSFISEDVDYNPGIAKIKQTVPIYLWHQWNQVAVWYQWNCASFIPQS